ncbi:MAG: hypothetical protein K2W95_18005 [Candidatus Obscuribacterales bacterium]|nr:hypothetical protein [Candidatus Obscuribacterales bacterium]
MKSIVIMLFAMVSCCAAIAQPQPTGSVANPITRARPIINSASIDREDKDQPVRTAITHLQNALSMSDRRKVLQELEVSDQYLHRPVSGDEMEHAFAILMLAAAFENAGKHQKSQALYAEFETEIRQKGKQDQQTPSGINQAILEFVVWAPLAAQNQQIGHTLAAEAYRRARQLKPQDDYQIAKALSLLGSFEQEKRNHTAAKRYLYQALATYELQDDKFEDMQRIRQQLVELELERDNYEAARRLSAKLIDSENTRQPLSNDLVRYIVQLSRILDRSGEHEKSNALYADWRERLKPRFAVYVNFLSAYARYARDYGDSNLANKLDKEFTGLNKALMTWWQVRDALQSYANDLRRAGFDSLSQKVTKANMQIRAIHEQDRTPETTVATAFGAAPRPLLQTLVPDPAPEKLRLAALKQSANVSYALQRYEKDLDSIGTDSQKQELKSVQSLLAEIKKGAGKID